MFAIGYDCSGTRLFEVHSNSSKKLDVLINLNWSQEVNNVSVYKNNGELLKTITPLED